MAASPKPIGDEGDLALVPGHVAGRVDARDRRLHRRSGSTRICRLPWKLEAPVGDRAEVGVEAEERDERVALDLEGLAGGRVLERHGLDGAVAAHARAPRAGLQMRTSPCSSSSRASLTEVSSARKRSRRWTSVIGLSRRVLQAERPVEGGVAAADDDAGLVAEDVLAPDEVVEALALPGVDVLDLELARLEGAVAGGDDQRARREGLALVRGEDEDLLAVGADPLEVLDLLVRGARRRRTGGPARRRGRRAPGPGSSGCPATS